MTLTPTQPKSFQYFSKPLYGHGFSIFRFPKANKCPLVARGPQSLSQDQLL